MSPRPSFPRFFKDARLDRRAFIGTLAGSLLAAPLAAEAQPVPNESADLRTRLWR